MRPVGGQAALGKDQHKGARPQRLRQLGVVEPYADARLAKRQPQSEEAEQRGQADLVGDPGRHDGDQHHDCANEQHEGGIAGNHGRLSMTAPKPRRSSEPTVCQMGCYQPGDHFRHSCTNQA